jgi:phosphatidylserine synthase
VRVLGAFIFFAASAALAYSVVAVDESRRPKDVFFSGVATLAATLAIVGLTLVFVPDFFG